jgi:ankyrin repeat protein
MDGVHNKLVVRAGVAFAAAAAWGLLPPAAFAADQRLVDAVKRQDKAEIGALLRARVPVNDPQPDGTTALHWAVYHDDGETIRALIRAGANVNATTDTGITPLWVGCHANSSAPSIRLLLGAGAKPNLAPATGETPLMWCARAGAVEALKALLVNGAEVDAREKSSGQTALMWAVAARHPDIVKSLLEVGADARARTTVTSELVNKGFRYITAPPANRANIIETVKRGGFTPFLFAAQQGDVQSAELLLKAGAEINDTDASGSSALVVAAHSGQGALAQMLLDRGADPNHAGAGYTALHAAVLRGDASLVKALLAKGANPDTRLASGTPVRKYGVDYALSAAWIGATPYWLAAKFAEPEIMRALALAKADTRRPIPDGTTPLMATLMGSTPGQGDRRERFQTEVQVAAAAPTQEAVTTAAAATALELGAEVNATSNAGDTALHMAAARGLVPVIKLLADAGAALEVRNKRGQTPLAAASVRRGPQPFEGDGTAAAKQQPNRAAELLRSLGAKE